MANEAFDLASSEDNSQLIAQSLSKLCLFNMIKGNYDLCRNQGEKAIGLFKVSGDDKGVADVKYSIAGVYYKTDNFHLGLIYLIDCLEIYRKLDDHHNLARVQKSLGTIYEYFGDQKSAMMAYETSVACSKKVKDTNLESNAYNPLSGIYLNRGEIEKASDLIEQSIAMKLETEDIRGLGFALYGKAKVQIKQKKYKEAEATFFDSIDIHQRMGEKLGSAMCYHKLGALYLEQGDFEKARDILTEALIFADAYSIVLIKFKCNYLLYELYKKTGDAEEALKYLEIYLKEKETVINTQTQKVIESYEAISKVEQLQKEAQMNREKAEILKKKNLAEEGSRVKQEFLSTMSHEIRTPLNAVITITSLLKEHISHEGKELLESLSFSSANLLQIINDILDFNKLDVGKVTLDRRPQNFRKLMVSICNIYEALAKEKGIAFNLNIDSRLAQCYELDDTKMYQILGNLISNAIKFTSIGSISVEISIVEEHDEWDQIEFRIVDSGRGISPGFMGDIFESFSQPKSHTTKDQGGSGLGLAIVKKLIQLHGSNIEVASEEGKGSKFFFQLSLQKGKMENEDSVSIEKQLKHKNVLLAEDNLINAMVAKKLLTKQGLMVSLAKNGEEAVKIANEQSFDVILMDIHMPKMNGFDAASNIKASSEMNKHTPIFALTADVTAYQGDNNEDFEGFLLKPIEQDKLFSALART